MNVALRAAADRFIYDVAALRTIGDSLEEAEFDAVCAVTGRTVAATFGLLVAHYRAVAVALGALPGPTHGANLELPTVEPVDGLDPDEVDESLASIICDIVDGLSTLPSGNATPAVINAVTGWSSVGAQHALDFLEAVPDLVADPLLLNWAIFPVPGEPAGLHARRLDLVKRAREAGKK